MQRLKIAGIGAWHTHSMDFTNRVMQHPGAEVAMVWDQDPERGRAWAQACGCIYQPDLEAVLSDASIDAVTITCETTLHAEMILKAARAGKHIYVEKPPFLTVEQARLAQEVIQEHHVKFMVGSPIVKPMHRKTMQLLRAGLLGEVVSMRYRTVHELAYLGTQKESFFQREANGGGAMQDMGSHALHLLSWFAGAPVRTKAIYTSYTEKAKHYGVDDNDIAVLEFENGVLGTIETGWVTPWYQYGFDLYGTKGSVSCRAYEMYVCLEDGIWRRVPEEELPEAEQYPLHEWLDCIREDRPIQRDGIDVAVLMTEMAEAVERAAQKPLLPPKRLRCKGETVQMPGWKRAREMAESGRLGEVLNIRVHCCGEASLEVLTEQAKEILFHFFGAPLGEKIVISSAGVRKGESAVVLLLYEGKRLGIAEACSAMPGSENGMDICATHGWLRIRGDQVCYTTSEPGDRNAIWHDLCVEENSMQQQEQVPQA